MLDAYLLKINLCFREGLKVPKYYNVVERWFFYIKHRLKRFYKRFPWNAKYETVYRWFASFIVIYTISELKS